MSLCLCRCLDDEQRETCEDGAFMEPLGKRGVERRLEWWVRRDSCVIYNKCLWIWWWRFPLTYVSFSSSLWQTVSSQEREKCLSVVDDGEFWRVKHFKTFSHADRLVHHFPQKIYGFIYLDLSCIITGWIWRTSVSSLQIWTSVVWIQTSLMRTRLFSGEALWLRVAGLQEQQLEAAWIIKVIYYTEIFLTTQEIRMTTINPTESKIQHPKFSLLTLLLNYKSSDKSKLKNLLLLIKASRSSLNVVFNF